MAATGSSACETSSSLKVRPAVGRRIRGAARRARNRPARAPAHHRPAVPAGDQERQDDFELEVSSKTIIAPVSGATVAPATTAPIPTAA